MSDERDGLADFVTYRISDLPGYAAWLSKKLSEGESIKDLERATMGDIITSPKTAAKDCSSKLDQILDMQKWGDLSLEEKREDLMRRYPKSR